MGRLSICGARVITPGRDLGVTDIVVEGVSNVAGSVALYPQCFKRFVKATGLPLEEAVKATSYNQCVSLGIPDRGEIAPGKIADIVLVDHELTPVKTIVAGREYPLPDAVKR